jgi:23S rRNA (pseudouridine1915-N3)-methyltransferase
MKIYFVNIGKTDSKELDSLIKKYELRLKKFLPFELDYIQIPKYTGKLKSNDLKSLEGMAILKKIEQADYVILLDEKGKQFSSNDFAQFLQRKMNTGIKSLMFISGGAYGFSEEVYKSAHETLSLSKMTTTHQLVRLFFTEQLYRAFTILNNHPYHNN